MRRAIAQSRATARSQEAGIQSSRAALAQHRAEDETAEDYVLAAPVDGTVTAIVARPGLPAGPQQQLMVVMPVNARPQAELYVPTQAAGFLAPGQEVRLAVDAFPYQSFGTVPARIVRISSAAIPAPGPRATPSPSIWSPPSSPSPGCSRSAAASPCFPA